MRYTFPISLIFCCCFSLGAQPIFQPDYLHRLDSALNTGIKFAETHFAWKFHLQDVFEYGMGLEEMYSLERVDYKEYSRSLVYRYFLFESELDEIAFHWALLNSSKESELFQKGFELFKKGSLEEAIKLLQQDRASRYNTGTPAQQIHNSLFLADMLVLQQRFSEAEPIYQSLLSIMPQDPELHWKIAFHYHLQNKYDLATVAYAKGLAILAPDDWRRGAFLKPLSRLQNDTNDKQGARLNNTLGIELWLKQKEKNPHNLAIDFLLVKSYDYSIFFEDQQHISVIQKQIDILESLVNQFSQNVNLKILLAQYYENKYKFRSQVQDGSNYAVDVEAVNRWKELSAKHPGSPVILFNLAQLYSLIEDRERDVIEQHDFMVYFKRQKKILKELEKSSASPYVNYLALSEYVSMIYRSEYDKEAISVIQNLIQLEESILKVRPYYTAIIKKLDLTYTYLATLSFRNNDFQKSIDYHWNRIQLVDDLRLKKTPQQFNLIAIDANIEIGNALHKLSDPRKAIGFYLSAVQIIEEDPANNYSSTLANAYYLLGNAHRKLLETDLALRYYQKAAKLYEALLKEKFYDKWRSAYDKVLDSIESLNKE